MFDISSDYSITITRGDTATLEITFYGDSPGSGDTVIAALKKAPGRTDVIREWTLAPQADGTFLLTIDSEDTASLPFGRYFWDLRVLYADGQVTTPFAAKTFQVTEVVTDLPAGDGG